MLPDTRSLIIGLHSLLLCGSVYAQSASQDVLANAGATGTIGAGYTIDYTVGEVAISTIGSSPVLTQGFHQPLSPSPLPVRLLSFSARGQNGQSLLTWRTVTETNNRFFVIERSGDGQNFILLDTVASKSPDGNSNRPLQYTYTDRWPLSKNFYRLRQVDIDGQFMYSPIAIVSFDAGNQWLLFTYPNPVQQQLNLVINAAEATVGTCIITSVTGHVVHKQKLLLVKGNNRYTMPVQAFPTGMFFIRIENAGRAWSMTGRFVKQ